MAGCHAGIHDDSRGGVSCGADVLRDEPEDIYVHAFYRAVSHAVVFLCEWILGMEGGHDLDAEPTGHDDLEEVQDSGHPYDCVPDGVPRGEGEGILACHGACDGFANEERILVHVGVADYVRDLLCVRLL